MKLIKMKTINAVVVSVLVIIMMKAEHSWELRLDHPLHDIVDRVNERGPYIGLVMAFPAEELVLESSGLFLPSADFPLLQLSGRKFNIGTIKGVSVIYVMSGEQTVNAGVAVQILYDVFDVIGVVHYGIAGSTNDSLLIGDVSIPNYVAFTGSWDWLGYGSSSKSKSKSNSNSNSNSDEVVTELRFGEFNLPQKGQNLLAEVEFTPVQVFSQTSNSNDLGPRNKVIGGQMQKLFWLPVDQYWFTLAATQLKDIELHKCLNDYCLKDTPKSVFGLRGSTSDVYLNNGAYRRFLFEKLNVSTADEESASVVMTSLSNGKPSIVFRGISDMAGGSGAGATTGTSSTTTTISLAATNALRLAVEFIHLIGPLHTHQSSPIYYARELSN